MVIIMGPFFRRKFLTLLYAITLCSFGYAWNGIIEAAEGGDYQRLRSLVVDYYYPVLLTAYFKDDARTQKTFATFARLGLKTRILAEAENLVKEGLEKDLARIEKIGQTISIKMQNPSEGKNFLTNASDWREARLRFLPDIHPDMEVGIANLSSLLHLWKDDDMVLIEGNLETVESDTSYITSHIIGKLANEKALHIERHGDDGLLPSEIHTINNAIFELFLDGGFIKDVFDRRDGRWHLKALPYKNIQAVGWDVITSDKVSRNPKYELEQACSTNRDVQLASMADKYLSKVSGNLYVEAGAAHIPHTQYEWAKKEQEYIQDYFGDQEREIFLELMDLKNLPGSLEECFVDKALVPKSFLKLKETYQLMRRTKYVVFCSPEYYQGRKHYAGFQVSSTEKNIKKSLQTPGPYGHLFKVIGACSYDQVKSLIANLYWPFFVDHQHGWSVNASCAYLLLKRGYFHQFKLDLDTLFKQGVSKDFGVVKDLWGQNFSSGSPSMSTAAQESFTVRSVPSSYQHKSTIHFVSNNRINDRRSFIQFLAEQKLFDFDNDGIIFPEYFEDTHHYLKDLSVETSDVLQQLALNKCLNAGTSSPYNDYIDFANEYSRALRNIKRNGTDTLAKEPRCGGYHHLTLLPERRYQVAYFEGENFEQEQLSILEKIRTLKKNGSQNIWILTPNNMNPEFAALRYSLLKQVLGEENISSTQVSLVDTNMSLASIYEQTINKKINLDRHKIWLPTLPSILFDGLGALSFSAYYPASQVNALKEDIRQNLMRHIDRQNRPYDEH